MLEEISNPRDRSAPEVEEREKKMTDIINVQNANTHGIDADIVCHYFVFHFCNLWVLKVRRNNVVFNERINTSNNKEEEKKNQRNEEK